VLCLDITNHNTKGRALLCVRIWAWQPAARSPEQAACLPVCVSGPASLCARLPAQREPSFGPERRRRDWKRRVLNANECQRLCVCVRALFLCAPVVANLKSRERRLQVWPFAFIRAHTHTQTDFSNLTFSRSLSCAADECVQCNFLPPSVARSSISCAPPGSSCFVCA